MMNRFLFTLHTWRVAAFIAVQARAAALRNAVTSATSPQRERLAEVTQRLATVAQRTGAAVHKAAWEISPLYPCDLCGTHFGQSGIGDMQFCERHAELYANRLPIAWLDAIEAAEDGRIIGRAQSNSILAALCFIADSGDPNWEKVGLDYLTRSSVLFKGVKRLKSEGRKDAVSAAQASRNFVEDIAKLRREDAMLVDGDSLDSLTDEQMERLVRDMAKDGTLRDLGEAVDASSPAGLTPHALTAGEVVVLRYLSAQKTANGDSLFVVWDTIRQEPSLEKMGPVAISEALVSLTEKHLIVKQGKPAVMGDAWRSAVDIAADFGSDAVAPVAGAKPSVAERKAKSGFRVIDGGGQTTPPKAWANSPPVEHVKPKPTTLVTTGDDGDSDGCA
jgi:hypothetical protein